jgi:hypothetical protein
VGQCTIWVCDMQRSHCNSQGKSRKSERRMYTGGVGPGFQPAAGLLPGVVCVNKLVSDARTAPARKPSPPSLPFHFHVVHLLCSSGVTAWRSEPAAVIDLRLLCSSWDVSYWPKRSLVISERFGENSFYYGHGPKLVEVVCGFRSIESRGVRQKFRRLGRFFTVA